MPAGVATLQPRLIGDRPARVWFDDASFVLVGTIESLRANGLPESLTASTDALRVRVRTTDAALKVEAEGMSGFLPFSHTGVRRGQEADIEALIGQTFPAVVVEAPSGKDKDLVVSRRLLLKGGRGGS